VCVADSVVCVVDGGSGRDARALGADFVSASSAAKVARCPIPAAQSKLIPKEIATRARRVRLASAHPSNPSIEQITARRPSIPGE